MDEEKNTFIPIQDSIEDNYNNQDQVENYGDLYGKENSNYLNGHNKNSSFNNHNNRNEEKQEHDVVFEEVETPFISCLKNFMQENNLHYTNFNQLKVDLLSEKNEKLKDDFVDRVGENFVSFIDDFNALSKLEDSYNHLRQIKPQISFTYVIPEPEKLHEATDYHFKLPDDVVKLYRDAETLNAKSVPKINLKNMKLGSILASFKRVFVKMTKEAITARLGDDNVLAKVSQATQIAKNLKKNMKMKNIKKFVKKQAKNQMKKAKEAIKNEVSNQFDIAKNKLKDAAIEKLKSSGIDLNNIQANIANLKNFEQLGQLADVGKLKDQLSELKDKAKNINLNVLDNVNIEGLKNINLKNFDPKNMESYKEIQDQINSQINQIQDQVVQNINQVQDNVNQITNTVEQVEKEGMDINSSLAEKKALIMSELSDKKELAESTIKEINDTALNAKDKIISVDVKAEADRAADAIKEEANKLIEEEKNKILDCLVKFKDSTIAKIKGIFTTSTANNTNNTKDEKEDENKPKLNPEEEKKKLIADYENLLKELFKSMDQISQFVFDSILIPVYTNLNQEDEENLDTERENLNKEESHKHDKNEIFFQFIAFFSSVVCYFTNLSCKYYIDELERFNVDFYLDEHKVDFLAAKMHYSLNYRIFYRNKVTNSKMPEPEELSKKEIIELNNVDRSILLFGELTKNYSGFNEAMGTKSDIRKVERLSNLTVYDNPMYHPPYDEYKNDLTYRNFYRRYDYKDRLHLCEKCYYLPTTSYDNEKVKKINPDCSSVFRSIDITRLVSLEMEKIIEVQRLSEEMVNEDFNYLKLLKRIIVNHNYKCFDLNSQQISKLCVMNPILNVEICSMIHKFRNLFGEELAFYFMWISHFISYLYFPAAFGVIVFILCQIAQSYFGDQYYIDNKVDLIIKFPFTFVVMVWAKIYIDSWNKVEEIFNYEWGMNDYCVENGALKTCKKFNKFLNVEMPVIDGNESKFRQAVSWTITIIMLIFVMLSNKLVFFFSHFIRTYYNDFVTNHNLGQYIAPGSLFIIRQVNSQIFENISESLSNWEIHATVADKRNSQVIKSIAFQFFNYYFNLYYIAFYKNFAETCEYNNCKIELETQVTVLLLSAILNDFISIIYFQFFSSRHILNKIKELKKKLKSNEIDDDSDALEVEEHEESNLNNNNNEGDQDGSKIKSPGNKKLRENQKILSKDASSKHNYYIRKIYEDSNADKEYIEITLSFGYVIQFGSSSPICFFLCLIQAVLARVADSLKLGIFNHVNFSNGSKGIGPHSKIISFMITMGVITTLVINFISDSRMDEYSLAGRFAVIIFFENVVFVMLMFMELQKLPLWFNFKNQIKVSYLNYVKSNSTINPSNVQIEQ